MKKEHLSLLVSVGVIVAMVFWVIVAKPYERPMGMTIILILSVGIGILLTVGRVGRK